MKHKLIKTAGRNINNLRYADNTPLVAESKEEIKSLLGRVKDESKKAGLKLSFQKSKVIALSRITPWQLGGEKVESDRYYFLGLQNHCRL